MDDRTTRPLSLYALVLLLSLSCASCSNDLRLLRVSPDPGTTVSERSSARLTIAFNEPVSEGASGNVSIYRNSSAHRFLVPVFSQSIHSSYITISEATVTILLDAPLPAGSRYIVTAASKCFVASSTGDVFEGIALEDEWAFEVTKEGPPFYSSSVPSSLSHADVVKGVIAELDPQHVHDTIAYLSENYLNRFFQSDSGLAAHEWLRAQYQTIVDKYQRGSSVSVTSYEHRWLMPSLIVHIAADADATSAPYNSGEIVVLGAHLDSINRQNWTTNAVTGRAPGADDDASGIAVGLELFRVLMKQRGTFTLARAIEIHAYAAEEEGLYGSADVAASFQRNGARVAGMLQLDQCGYVRDPANERLALFVDNTDPLLNNFTMLNVEQYQSLPCVLSDEDGRADSDFHSWTDNGFRASYIAEGPVDDIVYGNDKHTAYDLLSGVSISHVMSIANAAAGFVLELALAH
eukprot:TRINITY_DN14685_c0_g1_i1.p1 TRINITY_DN14685_c0_g1~~TRINITY_DN14685_c0_g1_i1.p1  ORF type:complete len:481 (+),score=110.11 TRINITY_DN14685_c0_g1_i1:55-1443(+)